MSRRQPAAGGPCRVQAALMAMLVALVGVAACEPERTRPPGAEPPLVASEAASPDAQSDRLRLESDTAVPGAARGTAGGEASARELAATGAAANVVRAPADARGVDHGDGVAADWDLVHGPVATAMASLTATLTAEPPSADEAELDPTAFAMRLAEADDLLALGYREEAEKAYRDLLHAPDPARVGAAVALSRFALRDDDPASALALLTYAAPGGLETLPAAGLYHFGDAAERVFEYPAATAAYRLFGEAVPEMADVASLAAGNALYSSGRHHEALQAFTAARDGAGDDSTAYLAALRRGNALLRLGPPLEAAEAYEEAFDLATNDADRANALAGVIAAQLEAADDAAATETRRRLVRDLPTSPLAPTALERLAESGAVVPEHEMAAVLAGSGDHAAAVAAYESAIADQADAPTAWQLAVVQAHRAAGDHAAAIAAADRLIAGRSGDPLAPEAAWLRGLSQQSARSYRAAADSFAALALTWPLADRAPEALWRRAAIVLDLDGSMAGADAFDDLANRYPGYDQALEARFRSAFLRLFAGYTSDAEARLSALAAEGDAEARARASFWLGRIAFDRGDPATAVERWREAASADAADFYGLRAAQRLGDEPAPTADEPADPEADIAAWLASWRPGFDAADWQSAREEIAADRDVARSAAWLDLGERRAAVRTIDNAVQAHADDPVALAGLSLEARGLNLHGASIAAARRAQNAAPEHLRAEPPDALMRLVYPDAYGALVRDAASERGVPAALLFALIRSESRFEPSARSSAGALGLTQVMPATGQSIAGWLGEESFDPVDLYRPETAARFGAWFLGQQLESNDRQVPLALAAYNGGPGNAQRWWADAGGDIDAVAEVIDYSETRNYVRWVIEAQARYEQLYGDLGQ